MAEPSPRPTREQVDAAVRYADECCSPDDPAAIVRHLRATSAEVRALRADLDRVRSALRHESDAHIAERGRLRAALAAHTPQPAEQADAHDAEFWRLVQAGYSYQEAQRRSMLAAPLPAVPDGEDRLAAMIRAAVRAALARPMGDRR